MTTLHTTSSNENFYWCRMKCLTSLKRVVRITVRWEWAINVIRPEAMNAKICIRLPSCWEATTLLCVTEWSWPLQLQNPKELMIWQRRLILSNYSKHELSNAILYYLLNKVEEIKFLWSTENWERVQQQQHKLN